MLAEAALTASLQNILGPGLDVLGSRDLCDGNDLHCDWISSGPPHLDGQLLTLTVNSILQRCGSRNC